MRGEGEAGEAGIDWSLRGRAACAEQLLTLNVCPEEKIVKRKSDSDVICVGITYSRLVPIMIDVFLVKNSSNFLATPTPRNNSDYS